MKLINKLKITYKMIEKRWFVTILIFLICLLSFYLSDKVFFNYYKTYNNIFHEKNAYSINPYNINKITFSAKSGYEEGIKIGEIISKIPEIEFSGKISNSSVLSVDSKETIDTIVCDNNLSSVCNIGISEELKQQINNNSSEFEYVLLGDSFKGEYSINDMFKCLGKNGDVECVVAGFLDSDAQFLISETNNIKYYNLKQCGLILTKRYDELFSFDEMTSFVTPIYYVCDSKVRNDVENKIIHMMQKKGINAAITNEGEKLEDRISEINISSDKEFMAALLLFLISILSISTVNIVECIINKKDYALLIICGCKYNDIYSLVIIKNLVIIFISGIFAYLYSQFMIFGSLIPNMHKFTIAYNYYYARMAHCIEVPLILFFELLFMIAVSCLIPIILIRRAKIIDMMKN